MVLVVGPDERPRSWWRRRRRSSGSREGAAADDQALAELLARDLRQNLVARAPDLRDVYGVALFTEDVGGYFLVSVATEEEYERQRQFPAYAARPEEELSGPGGLRWSVGDWHRFPDDEFVSDETSAALEPLVARLQDVEVDEGEFALLCQRWWDLAVAALELARPLDLLPCTEDAIAFVSLPRTTVQDDLALMARTVPAERLQALFPGWQRPAD